MPWQELYLIIYIIVANQKEFIGMNTCQIQIGIIVLSTE